MMASTFRLYGPQIGEPTAVVDADVTGVSPNGSIQLTYNSGNSTTQIDPSKLRNMTDRNLAYDLANVDENDPIWKAIKDVENRYRNAPDDKDAFIEAAKTLFQDAG